MVRGSELCWVSRRSTAFLGGMRLLRGVFDIVEWGCLGMERFLGCEEFFDVVYGVVGAFLRFIVFGSLL